MDRNEVLYIIGHFGNLFTEAERNLLKKIRKVNMYLDIIKDVDMDLAPKYLNEVGISESDILEVQNLDKNGIYDAIAKRIASENDLFINRCPYCGEIARTPTAYQARCGHQWRDHVLIEVDGKKKWVKK